MSADRDLVAVLLPKTEEDDGASDVASLEETPPDSLASPPSTPTLEGETGTELTPPLPAEPEPKAQPSADEPPDSSTGNKVATSQQQPAAPVTPGSRHFSLAQLVAVAGVAALLGLMPFVVQLLAARQSGPDPLPAEGALLWFADQERGDLSQWTRGQSGEAVFNTGTGQVTATRELTHSGSWSIMMRIDDAAGQTQAGRIFRWSDTPAEGYYSAWFYFPERYQPASWWNVFQFKSGYQGSDPTWIVNVGNRANGAMYLYLWDAINRRAYDVQLTPVNLPVGRWVEIKAYYRRASDRTGRITLWQDGVRLFDLDGVQTTTSEELHWGLSNYTDDIQPPDVTIYADDAAIRGVE